MDTATLKSFAAWARTALIREITARIAVVLAPASAERVEQPQAVAGLEKAIGAAGGGDDGRAAVADRVAYTWFNRIIALRFMDANGYTGIGVVSPQADVASGQPEVLADAKRGAFEDEVVSERTRQFVSGLLDGTRRSIDPQGEAYSLLLTEYCRHWNQAMPFMFERKGDFTELLVPGNLLADDSVLNRAVRVLTTDICKDVEVIGWLYQYYIAERKDEVFAGFTKGKKAGAEEIPAATQLFTPDWIVRFLVENSVGRVWMLNHPTSRLVDQMEYFIAPSGDELEYVKISKPEELTVIDPACGSGHMLTYAFELLYAIYEEEGYTPAEIPSLILSNNLFGTEIDARAGALAAFALMMKARGRQRTFFNSRIEPNICVVRPLRFSSAEIDILAMPSGDRIAEDAFWNQFADANTIGSLIAPDAALAARLSTHIESLRDDGDLFAQDVLSRAYAALGQAKFLAGQYSVAVANPPYMGNKNMAPKLAEFLSYQFADSKSDLYAAFIERCHAFVAPRGVVAMITMQSWTFQTTFAPLRRALLTANPLVALLGLGPGAFDSFGGEVVNTCAFVTTRTVDKHLVGAYLRLKSRGECEMASEFKSALHTGGLIRQDSSEFLGLPNAVIAYWLTPKQAARLSQGTKLGSIADARVGLQTGDNGRFLRQWWEVSFSETSMAGREEKPRWYPYSKGGPFRKWFGNMDLVIDWTADGKAVKENRDAHGKMKARPQNQTYYFRPAVEWSDIGQPVLGARMREAGAMFDVVSMSVFSRSDSDDELFEYLAYLNSCVADLFIKAVAPGMHANTGYVAMLPWLEPTGDGDVIARVRDCVEIAKKWWYLRETTSSFAIPALFPLRQESLRLEELAAATIARAESDATAMAIAETENNRYFMQLFGMEGEVEPFVSPSEVTLDMPTPATLVEELISYSVGCMFGRYSLNEPGLILADQGATLSDYVATVPAPQFMPDTDNVLPIVDGDWFEDDIVTRFRQFLRVAFGERHFEENLRFVTEALGVKDLRDYFVRSFYKDHVQRYKKRPIYWLFSSPRGSFNALIYMHRYTPSTASTVLNEYLREFKAKLAATLGQQERLAAGGGAPRQQAAAQKEADRIRKMLLELDEYEHDVLYPLASQQIKIDLDDGVKVNYPKFGAALKKIPGLEAGE